MPGSSSEASSLDNLLKIDVADYVTSIRRGVLFRSAWGVPPGLRAAVEHPLVKIDLRHNEEKKFEDLSLNDAMIVDIPVHQDDVVLVLGDRPGRPEYTRLYLGILDNCQPAIVQVLNAVARALVAGVMVGCSMGKDRTGVAVALILAVVGVPTPEIVQAERNMREVIASAAEPLLAEHDPLAREKILYRIRAAHESVGDCLDHCDEVHGSVWTYLTRIGTPDATVTQLRRLLLA